MNAELVGGAAPVPTTPPPTATPGGLQQQPEGSALSILEPNIKESAAARAELSQAEISADPTLVTTMQFMISVCKQLRIYWIVQQVFL